MVQTEVPAQVCEVTRQRLHGHDTCPKLRRQKGIEAGISAEVVEDPTRLGEATDCHLLARLVDAQPTTVGMGPDDPAAPPQRAGHDRYSDPSGYQRQGPPHEPSGQGFAGEL